MYARCAMSFFCTFESSYSSVLHPILLNLRILTRLIESFPMVYGLWRCIEVKLSIPLGAHAERPSKESFKRGNCLFLRPILVKFHNRTRLIESFPTTYQSWWCAEENFHLRPVQTSCQLKHDERPFPLLWRVVEFRGRYA